MQWPIANRAESGSTTVNLTVHPTVLSLELAPGFIHAFAGRGGPLFCEGAKAHGVVSPGRGEGEILEAAFLVAVEMGEHLVCQLGCDLTSFSWSPNRSKIAFAATIDPDLIHGGTADVYVVTLGDNSVDKIVSQPGPDSGSRWSPDDKQILFSTQMGRERYSAFNNELAVVPAEGGETRTLSEDFDENARFVDWNQDGIYFMAWQKTASHLFRLDPVEARRNGEHLAALEAALEAKRVEVRAGWGTQYVDRVHAKGKLTSWERIERLKDEDSTVFPVGTLVNYGLGFGPDQRSSPGAGYT